MWVHGLLWLMEASFRFTVSESINLKLQAVYGDSKTTPANMIVVVTPNYPGAETSPLQLRCSTRSCVTSRVCLDTSIQTGCDVEVLGFAQIQPRFR